MSQIQSTVFDSPVDRRSTNSLKWSGGTQLLTAKQVSADPLPLWVADMDFRAPEPVLAALQEAVEFGVFGYAAGMTASYLSAVTAWQARRFGWQVNPQWVVATSGVISALKTAIQAFSSPGDSVLIQTPVYVHFHSDVAINGRTVTAAPLTYNGSKYQFDPAVFEAALRDNTKIFILSNPHNLTGNVWTEDELRAMGEICQRRSILVVADEIHQDFVLTPGMRPVIVDNKPGAGSRLAAGQVKNTAADGTNVLLALTTTASISPTLYAGKVNYDFKTDYTPVAQIAKSPIVISVGENSKFSNVGELLAQAKRTPGKLNVGTSGVGTMSHLTLYRLESVTGSKTTMIPFRGGSHVVTDLIGGQLDAAVDTVGDHVEQHRSKKMRILGVFSAGRSSLVPDVPTMKEQGIELESESWYGLFVPSKTPKSIVAELQNAVAAALKDPDIQNRLNGMGMRPSYLDSAEFGKMLTEDAARWGAVVRESGIKPE